MKKFLSLFLSTVLVANVNGCVPVAANFENQTLGSSIGKSNETKKSKSSLGEKIGIGVGIGAGIIACVALGLTAWHFCAEENSPTSKKDNKPEDTVKVTDEEIRYLGDMAVLLLRRHSDDSNVKSSHVRECYHTYDEKWVSLRLRSIFPLTQYRAIESPRAGVNLVFVDAYEFSKCIDNVTSMLDNGYASILHLSSRVKRGYDSLEDLYYSLVAEFDWPFNEDKREYMELFRLYRELKPAFYKIAGKDSRSVGGFLIIEDRSGKSDDLARYRVCTISREELNPKVKK